MSKNRGYTRELTSHQWQILKKQYKMHITKKRLFVSKSEKTNFKNKKDGKGYCRF